ncbi:hypothetical protein TKK_0012801 [Trichogramma kaykai]
MSSKHKIVSVTQVKSDECIFTWTIENYRLIKLKVGEKIKSSQFSFGNNNKNYFKLKLYPSEESMECADYISLYILPVIDLTNKPDKLVCKCSFSAINDKKVYRKLTLHHDFVSDNFKGIGWSRYYELAKIDHLISSENTLTIQCELEVFEDFNNLSSLNCSDIINGENPISNELNLEELFCNEEFSDVKVKASDGNAIPAHKNILAVARPVFKAMFTHYMLENTENFVKIIDTTENILIEMLRFIYTGQIDAIEIDSIIELLAVADKYQIDNLKIKCGKMLCSDLSTENAVDILVAAHKYKEKFLEDKAIKFVTTHTQLLSDSEKMKKIDDTGLWVNLTQSIVKSQKTKVSCPVCHPENHS